MKIMKTVKKYIDSLIEININDVRSVIYFYDDRHQLFYAKTTVHSNDMPTHLKSCWWVHDTNYRKLGPYTADRDTVEKWMKLASGFVVSRPCDIKEVELSIKSGSIKRLSSRRVKLLQRLEMLPDQLENKKILSTVRSNKHDR